MEHIHENFYLFESFTAHYGGYKVLLEAPLTVQSGHENCTLKCPALGVELSAPSAEHAISAFQEIFLAALSEQRIFDRLTLEHEINDGLMIYASEAERLVKVSIPGTGHHFFEAALTFHHSGRLAEARRCYLLAKTHGYSSLQLDIILQVFLAASGQLEESLNAVTRLLSMGLTEGEELRQELRGIVPEFYALWRSATPDALFLELEAHSLMAELVVNYTGAIDTAVEIYERRKSRAANWLRITKPENKLLVFGNDWVRNIGHIAYLSYFAKLKRLGLLAEERLVLAVERNLVANYPMLDYLSQDMEVVHDKEQLDALLPIGSATTCSLAFAHLSGIETVLGRLDPCKDADRLWEDSGRGALYQLSPQHQESGNNMLRAFGIPSGAWFVTLHLRDSSFHEENERFYQQQIRNADPLTYTDAIKEITASGGWVVFMGDNSSRRLPPMERVIFYHESDFKSPEMDVYLLARCRFFIGVNSGPALVPSAFGVPCLFTNFVCPHPPMGCRGSLIVPKLIRSRESGPTWTIRDLYSPPTSYLAYSGFLLQANNLELIDNTPSELAEAVKEMLERNMRQDITRSQKSMNEEASDTVMQNLGFRGPCRFSNSFLRLHPELLASV